ncbi:MFS transporter [Euzebya sp.]|uniref:MFS transporter n=1 Tax=Euzebya sp. TaxID=1971409 RepID=UPI003511304E
MRSTRDGRRPALGPEVRDVVLARLISSTGAEGAFFLGLWGKAAYAFDGTPGELALMSALVALGAMAGSVIGGVAVDRFDARRVVLAAEGVFVPATLLLIVARDMPTLLAFGIVSWLAGAVLETAIVSLPPVLTTPERLEQANARLESANWTALIIGPAVAAPLVTAFGVDSVFLFDALTSVVALALIARIHLPEREESPTAGGREHASSLRQTLDGLAYAVGSPPIRLALYLGALIEVAFGMFVALEPLFFRDVVGVGVEAIGYVNAVFGAGLLAGSLGLERLAGRWSGFRTLTGLVGLSGIGGVLYVATPSLVTVLIGAVVWSVPLGAALPLVRTLAQQHADPAYTGRVMGAIGMVASGLAIMPLVVAPALAAALGVQGVLMASASIALIGAPWVLGRAARLDRDRPAGVPHEPHPPVAAPSPKGMPSPTPDLDPT